MATLDLFSKRQKKQRGEVPDVYSYDNFSQKMKVQIVHIIQDTIGVASYVSPTNSDKAAEVYQAIHQAIAKEYGLFTLGTRHQTDREAIFTYLLDTKNYEEVLDITELFFKYFDNGLRRDYNYTQYVQVKMSVDEAIEELNDRFKENGYGYAFEGGQIIRIDSTFTHSEITKPTLKLLWNKIYTNANEEYLKAHNHYLHGRNKESLAECLKAFESVMKIICSKKGWTYKPTDTASKLILVCIDNGLIPSYLQNQFNNLKSLLESGVPALRNNLGGHGQGEVKKDAEDHIVRYALNLTASNIIFLIEQSRVH